MTGLAASMAAPDPLQAAMARHLGFDRIEAGLRAAAVAWDARLLAARGDFAAVQQRVRAAGADSPGAARAALAEARPLVEDLAAEFAQLFKAPLADAHARLRQPTEADVDRRAAAMRARLLAVLDRYDAELTEAFAADQAWRADFGALIADAFAEPTP